MSDEPRNIRVHYGSTDPDSADDTQLIACLQSGCTDCFALLFRRYCRLVFSIAYRILREKSEAEDIVQEVFMTIFLHRNPYESTRGSVPTWIAQFAHFKALQRRRRLASHSAVQFEEFSKFEQFASRPGGGGSILERAAVVEEALGVLNPRQRRTIELVHFDGYTLAETAEILQESLANTRNHYYRGLKMLRQRLLSTSCPADLAASASLHRAVPHSAKS